METENNIKMKNIGSDDVISLSNKLCKLENFLLALNKFLKIEGEYGAASNLSTILYQHQIENSTEDILLLLNEGVDSEVLKVAANGWKKGKFKINIALEFIPDEPETPEYESPLDEIRREMNQGL